MAATAVATSAATCSGEKCRTRPAADPPAARALLALLALRLRALAGRALGRAPAAALPAQVLEQPAAQQHLALLRREVVAQLDLVAVVDDGGDGVRALLELLAQPREPPGLAHLGAPVVLLVGEGQRHDPLGHEVAAVDAREGLGDHRVHAELERRERGVLARGALAVVVAADDEACLPLADALAEPGSRWRRVNSAIAGTLER